MFERPKSSNDLSAVSSPAAALPVLSKDKLNFSQSANYVNRTKRFVVRIPELEHGGEPMVHPEGSSKAGQPIKTLEDGRTPDRGIVFYNGKDNVWQAVRGNGTETILITGVEDEQAKKLNSKEEELLNGRSVHSLETVKALLTYAKYELALIDFQNKKMASVEKDMGPIEGSCSSSLSTSPNLESSSGNSTSNHSLCESNDT